jgi:hypothetical protein
MNDMNILEKNKQIAELENKLRQVEANAIRLQERVDEKNHEIIRLNKRFNTMVSHLQDAVKLAIDPWQNDLSNIKIER